MVKNPIIHAEYIIKIPEEHFHKLDVKRFSIIDDFSDIAMEVDFECSIYPIISENLINSDNKQLFIIQQIGNKRTTFDIYIKEITSSLWKENYIYIKAYILGITHSTIDYQTGIIS